MCCVCKALAVAFVWGEAHRRVSRTLFAKSLGAVRQSANQRNTSRRRSQIEATKHRGGDPKSNSNPKPDTPQAYSDNQPSH